MMCLAEALLRIPDAHTADELIADKLSGPDWSDKLGRSDIVVRQRRDLLAAADRQGARRRQRPLGQLARGAGPRGRAARRAGRPHRGARGDEDPRPQFRLRPDHRRGAEARRARAASRASATASTCSARRRRPSRMPSATPKPIASALDRIAKEAKGGFRKSPGISVKLTALHPRFEFTHRDEARRGGAAGRSRAGAQGVQGRRPFHHRRRGSRPARAAARRVRGAARRRRAVRRTAGAGSGSRSRPIRSAPRRLCDWVDRGGARAWPQADGPAGQGRLLGHRDQGRAGRRACPTIRCSRARSRPTSPISPARRSCSPRATSSTRPSRPTMPTRSAR